MTGIKNKISETGYCFIGSSIQLFINIFIVVVVGDVKMSKSGEIPH